MDKRTLPSRNAKNKAQDLFRQLASRQNASDEDSGNDDEGSKNSRDGFTSNEEKSETEIKSAESDIEAEIKAPVPRRQVRKPRKQNLKKTTKRRRSHTEIEEITIKEEQDSENEIDSQIEDPQSSLATSKFFPMTFTIIKQALKDPNTAIWTTSAFTLTAVLNDEANEITPNDKETNQSDVEDTIEGTKTTSIPCPLCNLSFSKMKLKRHIGTDHPGVERPFKCDICDKTWKSWDRLNDHRISHSDTAVHQCDLCEKSFKRKYTLQAHVFYKHSASDGETRKSIFQTKRVIQKPFEPLGRSVGPYKIDRNALPPFKCPEPNCEELHDTICRLQRHFAQVHRDRNWICETCGKSYPGQRELIVHHRCHTDSRPFVCEKCGSTYKSKAHLNSHILRSHDEQGHEAYKAYRRITVKKLKLTKKKLLESEANSGTS